MVLDNFSIVLDNPVKVFFPGKLVTGNVQITTTRSTRRDKEEKRKFII